MLLPLCEFAINNLGHRIGVMPTRVTCIENGTLQTASPGALVDRLAGRIGAGVVYTAWGPTRATVRIRPR